MMDDAGYNIQTGTATVEVKSNHRINIVKLLKLMDVEVGQKVKVTIEKVE